MVLGLIPLISSSISVLMTGHRPPLAFWIASVAASLIDRIVDPLETALGRLESDRRVAP